MKSRYSTVLRILGVATALGLAMVVGYVAAGSVQPSATQGAGQTYPTEKTSENMGYAGVGATAPDGYGRTLGGADAAPPTKDTATGASPAPDADRLVIMSASMAIRVDDVDKGVASVRRIAAAAGASISNLTVFAGEPGPSPVPLAGDVAVSQTSGPASAQITLRVPAAKLSAVERDCAELGMVLTQSSAEDDVTQQHLDLSARLKNLRAEEVRLRSFLNDATKVSEMLEVERELSRVRGEIESMQAQVTYLERQAAMATLSISLTEPGPVVSPGTGGWGLTDAVTDGIRTAAAFIRAGITVVIALVPVLLLLGAIGMVWRFVSRRRRRTESSHHTDE